MRTSHSHRPNQSFNINTVLRLYPVGEMLRRIREAIEPYPKAMLFELRDRGFDSLFAQICACIVSVRTFDEVSLPATLRLFERAKTPGELNQLTEDEVYETIRPASFGRQKAKILKEVAKVVMEKYEGHLPSDYKTLLDLPGIGPKAANLALGIACEVPALGVDIHVHRITNRWGYLKTDSPEESLLALADKLPKKYWVEMNELLVPFGKHICTGRQPKCSICPVFEYCERRGVKRSL